MGPSVCIYTSICGGYDDLKPQPEQTLPCDFVCFTDEPDRMSASPWLVVPMPLDPKATPRFRAKLPKVRPHAAFATIAAASGHRTDYDFTIWIDGSIQILRAEFAERLIAAAAEPGIALVVHPYRDCIYDEAPASLAPPTAHKYVGMRLLDQVERYRAGGYPEHNGLYALGVIARNMRNPVVRAVDEAWWDEIVRWSVRDQLSLPYALWKRGGRCATLELNVWRNDLFETWPHFDPMTDDLARRARPEFSARAFVDRPGGDSPGVYTASSGRWHLAGPAAGGDVAFSFGPGGDAFIPLLGDWDGDGVDSPGLYDRSSGTFFLRNSCSSGPAEVTFGFGPPGALPVAGDWDGDGRDGIGVFLPEAGVWALANRFEPGNAEIEFSFGAAGANVLPVAGDWTGSGRDGIGLYEPSSSGWFLLSDPTTGGEAETFDFGPAGGMPVIGDWNADGIDEIGVYLPQQRQAFLADANRPPSTCSRVLFDAPGTWPLAGRGDPPAPVSRG